MSEDAYHEEETGTLVEKMLHQVHLVGEGYVLSFGMLFFFFSKPMIISFVNLLFLGVQENPHLLFPVLGVYFIIMGAILNFQTVKFSTSFSLFPVFFS